MSPRKDLQGCGSGQSLTGTLRDNIKGRDVVLQVPGCKLN